MDPHNLPMLVLMPSDISMNVMTIMNSNMNIIEPPGGVGGGADCPSCPYGAYFIA